jgi:hypothetical protein
MMVWLRIMPGRHELQPDVGFGVPPENPSIDSVETGPQRELVD